MAVTVAVTKGDGAGGGSGLGAGSLDMVEVRGLEKQAAMCVWVGGGRMLTCRAHTPSLPLGKRPSSRPCRGPSSPSWRVLRRALSLQVSVNPMNGSRRSIDRPRSDPSKSQARRRLATH